MPRQAFEALNRWDRRELVGEIRDTVGSLEVGQSSR